MYFDKKTDSENNFRELLMPLTHRRNENKYLLKNVGSYEERYMARQNLVHRKRSEYEYK